MNRSGSFSRRGGTKMRVSEIQTNVMLSLSLWLTLVSFSIDDGDGSKQVQILSRLFQFTENVECGRISLELISWGPDSRARKIRRRLFPFSVNREIRHFHVVVVQSSRRIPGSLRSTKNFPLG